jgi:S-DNA-T family DNA segregation ATPase FtsK/SpoIIIE
VKSIVNKLKEYNYNYNYDDFFQIDRKRETQELIDDTDESDEYLGEAIEMVINAGTASTSYIQRGLKIGYSRAVHIIDQMEKRGIISGYDGSKPRRVLITKKQWEEQKKEIDRFMQEHPEMFEDK